VSAATLCPTRYARGVGAKILDLADEVIAGRKGKVRHARVQTVTHHHIGEGDAGCQYLHPRLARTRLRCIALHNLEHLRPTLLRKEHLLLLHPRVLSFVVPRVACFMPSSRPKNASNRKSSGLGQRRRHRRLALRSSALRKMCFRE
jgi:hypothetical protein